jgi:hypothetical protein
MAPALPLQEPTSSARMSARWSVRRLLLGTNESVSPCVTARGALWHDRGKDTGRGRHRGNSHQTPAASSARPSMRQSASKFDSPGCVQTPRLLDIIATTIARYAARLYSAAPDARLAQTMRAIPSSTTTEGHTRPPAAPACSRRCGRTAFRRFPRYGHEARAAARSRPTFPG